MSDRQKCETCHRLARLPETPEQKNRRLERARARKSVAPVSTPEIDIPEPVVEVAVPIKKARAPRAKKAMWFKNGK